MLHAICPQHWNFGFSKYADRYLAAILYRLNCGFDHCAVPTNRPLVAAAVCAPPPEHCIPMAETLC